MKTVAAQVHSSTPVTISKAASVLSKFVTAETGASQAVNAYLRRATAALDELVRLHSKSDRKKHKKHKSDSFSVTATGGTASRSVDLSRGPTNVSEKGRKKLGFEKMVDDESSLGKDTEKRKKTNKDGEFDGGRVGEEIERTKHKEKRRKRDSVGDSEVIAVENENRVVGKKRENKEEDSFREIEEIKNEDWKKRKNREVEEKSRDEIEEQLSSKKKKRRRGGQDDN